MVNSAWQVAILTKIKCIIFAIQSANCPFKMALSAIFFFAFNLLYYSQQFKSTEKISLSLHKKESRELLILILIYIHGEHFFF